MIPELQIKGEIQLRFAAEDVRRSQVIAFLDKSRLLVEQTRPAIGKTELRSLIILTYLRKRTGHQRFGFQARIENVMPERQVNVRQLSQPFLCDLRLWPRLRSETVFVRAFCEDREIRVSDVSGGGTHLVLKEGDCASLDVGALVQVRFVFEKGETTTDGKILQRWMDRDGLRHVRMKFFGEPEIRDFLYR